LSMKFSFVQNSKNGSHRNSVPGSIKITVEEADHAKLKANSTGLTDH
jgi:hypothetical protein